MNILYIHGFGSKFDAASDKIIELSKLGNVDGIDIDYTKSFNENRAMVISYILKTTPDVVVGTSMGGYMAAAIGSATGIPFVSINPAISPKTSLTKYVGTNTTYFGETYTLLQTTVDEYPNIATDGCGLVLLDMDDEVISADETANALRSVYDIIKFDGGNHRFTHMAESISYISQHVENAGLVYGAN